MNKNKLLVTPTQGYRDCKFSSREYLGVSPLSSSPVLVLSSLVLTLTEPVVAAAAASSSTAAAAAANASATGVGSEMPVDSMMR